MMACGTRSCSEETPASWETATASDAPHTHCFTQATVCDPLGGLTFGNQDRPAFIAGLPALRPRLATGVLVSSEIGPSICQHIKQRTRPDVARRQDVAIERPTSFSNASPSVPFSLDSPRSACCATTPNREETPFPSVTRDPVASHAIRCGLASLARRRHPNQASEARVPSPGPGPWASALTWQLTATSIEIFSPYRISQKRNS
jgi:hypothetical protein